MLALRNSLRGRFVWLGVLLFPVYNYAIYTMAVPFGPLFLIWVAILGISFYSFVGGVMAFDRDAVMSYFMNRRASVASGWFLIVAAVLFACLWLSDDLPALLSGSTPESIVEMGLPTNPVHVLDMGIYLPAALLTGIGLLRKHPLAHTVAAPFMGFLILTSVPILITPAMRATAQVPADWGIAVPLGTFSVVSMALLAWLLGTVRSTRRSGQFAGRVVDITY